MYIIAGLGNPGKEYAGTRHNAGFAVIDALADKYNIDVDTAKHKGLIGKGIIDGQKENVYVRLWIIIRQILMT